MSAINAASAHLLRRMKNMAENNNVPEEIKPSFDPSTSGIWPDDFGFLSQLLQGSLEQMTLD